MWDLRKLTRLVLLLQLLAYWLPLTLGAGLDAVGVGHDDTKHLRAYRERSEVAPQSTTEEMYWVSYDCSFDILVASFTMRFLNF